MRRLQSTAYLRGSRYSYLRLVEEHTRTACLSRKLQDVWKTKCCMSAREHVQSRKCKPPLTKAAKEAKAAAATELLRSSIRLIVLLIPPACFAQTSRNGVLFQMERNYLKSLGLCMA